MCFRTLPDLGAKFLQVFVRTSWASYPCDTRSIFPKRPLEETLIGPHSQTSPIAPRITRSETKNDNSQTPNANADKDALISAIKKPGISAGLSTIETSTDVSIITHLRSAQNASVTHTVTAWLRPDGQAMWLCSNRNLADSPRVRVDGINHIVKTTR